MDYSTIRQTNVEFSDGLTAESYEKIIHESWNRDLWCITFCMNDKSIWTHVYRQQDIPYMFEFVFKVELTDRYNKPHSKFYGVYVCTTDTPTHYHLITTNGNIRYGYTIILGDDNKVSKEIFKKTHYNDAGEIFQYITHNEYLYILYINMDGKFYITQGEITFRNKVGNLIDSQKKCIMYKIIYSSLEEKYIHKTKKSIKIKNDIMYIHIHSQRYPRISHTFNTINLITHEIKHCANYEHVSSNITIVYPEDVVFDYVSSSYLVLENDYSIYSTSMTYSGHGPSAVDQYDDWLEDGQHDIGSMGWTNTRLTYHAPDGTVYTIPILDTYIHKGFESMHMLTDSIICINYFGHGNITYFTCYYYFDRKRMVLIPISIIIVCDSRKMYVNYTSYDSKCVIINRKDNTQLSIIHSYKDIDEELLKENYITYDMIDFIKKYWYKLLPYCMQIE